MPNWKKVIVSGSDAALNSLYAPSITGSLHGTASYAIYAETASYSNRTLQTDVLVKNQSGANIAKGVVVRITGSNNASDIPRVVTASYEADNNSANTLGITTAAITNGSDGYVVTEGILTGVDTSAFTSGQLLYLGATGSIIGTAPVAPLHSVRLGEVIREQTNNGSIYVRIDNGYEIGELHDVRDTTTSTSYGDLLIKSASVWTNSKQLSGSYGLTGSLNATSFTGSLLGTASYATQALSASYAPSTPAFPYTGSAEITGSLGVTGSFSVLDSIDATNKILIGSGPIPGSTEDSVNWDSRTLLDSNGNFSVRWGTLRSLYDVNASQSVDWSNRLLKFDNGPGDYTVNWSSGLLRDTGSNSSVNWQDRITIDTSTKTSIDWQNRQLKDSSGNENLNWSSGIKITGSALVSGSLTVTGSLIVSGSSTFTNIGPAQFSGSFGVQGALIPGSPPMIPDTGPYDAIKIDDIAGQRILYGSPLQGASASVDFGNRTLFDNNALDTISWGGTGGEFSTFKYNAQQISATTRDSLYSNNRQGGQFLNDSYFDINVVDNDLVYLNTDGQWYQVDQTTNSSTKMLGIAKSVSSQTGSVLIEGDMVVTTGTGYPAVANAGYGLPIYIKQGAGTVMDTTAPVSGYVRLLGHCYYTPYAGATEWIMKFRPSNEWVQL